MKDGREAAGNREAEEGMKTKKMEGRSIYRRAPPLLSPPWPSPEGVEISHGREKNGGRDFR